MGKLTRFSPEVRERAVRLVLEQAREHPTQWGAVRSVAENGRARRNGGRAHACALLSLWFERRNLPSPLDHFQCFRRNERPGEGRGVRRTAPSRTLTSYLPFFPTLTVSTTVVFG